MGNSGDPRFLEQLDRCAEEEGEGVAHAGLRAAADVARRRIRGAVEAADALNASASLVGDVDRRIQGIEERDAESGGGTAA
jgi:hypothetical protein